MSAFLAKLIGGFLARFVEPPYWMKDTYYDMGLRWVIPAIGSFGKLIFVYIPSIVGAFFISFAGIIAVICIAIIAH